MYICKYIFMCIYLYLWYSFFASACGAPVCMLSRRKMIRIHPAMNMTLILCFYRVVEPDPPGCGSLALFSIFFHSTVSDERILVSVPG